MQAQGMKQGTQSQVLWDNPEGLGGEGGGRGVQDQGDTCTPMADSCWCMAKKKKKIPQCFKVIILQVKSIN